MRNRPPYIAKSNKPFALPRRGNGGSLTNSSRRPASTIHSRHGLGKITSSTASLDTQSLEAKFLQYKEIWENETLLLSDTSKIISHPAYLNIIRLGSPVLPFILKDMEQTQNHWFFALQQITGENPVLKEHSGNIEEMINDWLNWANEKQIVLHKYN
ncbi:MAG: hypothetical protein EBX41_04300 [Chitinophagia bacterium]|nr:hypothetical protein [Chitinophagia bacterium]